MASQLLLSTIAWDSVMQTLKRQSAVAMQSHLCWPHAQAHAQSHAHVTQGMSANVTAEMPASAEAVKHFPMVNRTLHSIRPQKHPPPRTPGL